MFRPRSANPFVDIIGRLAVFIASLVAVSLPLGYGWTSYSSLDESLEFKATIKASTLSNLIASNPDTWQYAENRMQGLMAREPVRLEQEQIRVLGSTDEVLLVSGTVPVTPLMSRSAPLFDAGRLVGRVEISASLRTWIYKTALSAFFGLLLGMLVYFGARTLPLRTLKRVSAALESEQTRAVTVLSAIHDAVIAIDEAGAVRQVNPAALALLEAGSAQDVLGHPFTKFVAPEYREDFTQLHRRVIEGASERMHYESLGLRGGRHWLETQSVPMQMNDQHAHLAVTRDVSEHKKYEEQLQHAAHYDVLTGLANRALLADRLRQGMTQVRRRNLSLAVVYLDLDGFKAINDTYGHALGDKLLTSIARRLQAAMRDGDTVARVGGDEFVAVLLDLEDTDHIYPVLHRLLEAARKPSSVDEHIFQISGSLGVTFFPQKDDIDAEQLMRQADQAMYQAKVAGKNRFHLFDEETDRHSRQRSERIEGMRQALAREEFVLYFQPKVNMRSGAVIGMEALIRWQHPQDGLLLPGRFLPLIENEAVSIDLGEWVIGAALRQIEEWESAGIHLTVGVNVSALQLQQDNFVERIRYLLRQHPGAAPSRLALEILETSALSDMQQVVSSIAACNQLGINFSLDDFGTGYSSLTYLRRLAVNELKIDRSFVRDILAKTGDLAILQGVLTLADAFQLHAIAEGVETLEHGQLLILAGCEVGQGFAIAHPMPAAEVVSWLQQWRPDPMWTRTTPLSPNYLAVLALSVEHRAWIIGVEHYLQGNVDRIPAGVRECSLGKWLESAEMAGLMDIQTLYEVKTLHDRVHAICDQLCDKFRKGELLDMETGVADLHAARDALLARMFAIGKNPPPAPDPQVPPAQPRLAVKF